MDIEGFNLFTGVGYGYAYSSGTMVNSNAPAVTSHECLKQCNSDSNCLFWDYGGGYCRLRSDDGQGIEPVTGYRYGQKHSKVGA